MGGQEKSKIMKRFTIQEIKNYIMTQDSLGDVMYNLSEENIIKANISDEEDEEDPNTEPNSNEWSTDVNDPIRSNY